MNRQKTQTPIFDRSTVINLLTNAIKVESYKYARNLSQTWLDTYSGDLVVESLFAQALLKEDRIDEAIPLIKEIVYVDPEYLPAQRLVAYSTNLTAFKSVATAQQSILALGGRVPNPDPSQNWSKPLKEAIAAFHQGEINQAEESFQTALAGNPDSPLPAVMHLKFVANTQSLGKTLDTAELYASRWPDTLTCLLILAHTLNQLGRPDEGIQLLHQAVSIDIGGQVAIRLWGNQHPYAGMWPVNPTIQPGFPVPADVATAIGWNQLPAGSSKAEGQSAGTDLPWKTKRKGRSLSKRAVNAAKKELEELAIQIQNPALGSADARYPAYVLLSSKKGLETQYGQENIPAILQSIQLVERTTKQLNGWNAYTLFVDDPMSTDAFDLPPALPNDPWSIKNVIHDLDKRLAAKGERIGALLIVGGEKVIPFHLLPNPTGHLGDCREVLGTIHSHCSNN